MRVRVFQDPKEKKRRGPKSCPWSVEWRENGRRRSKTIGSKDEAKDFATRKRAELLDRVAGVNTRKRWEDFVAEYVRDEVKASGKRPGTVALTELILTTFTKKAKPTWVYLIDAKTLDAFRRERMKDKGPKGTISPETVKKELRHLHAALGVAKRWKYLREVPDLPRIATDETEKPHVSEDHFLAMLKAVDVVTQPDRKLHSDMSETITPADWWRALLWTCMATGARIGAVLKLRWEDVDFGTGRVLSRAADLKQRKDSRPDISAALPFLLKIRGADPRLLPWNHDRRSLYPQFHRIQKAAGVHLTCPDAGREGHMCTATCHYYGFHAFRYAHARMNYDNPQLQNQMGHSCASTTEHYKKWAARQLEEYSPKLPGEDTKQRENSGKNSGKPRFRIVG